jgi:YVTN family beta-propeller protein
MPDQSSVEISHMNTMNANKKSGIFFPAIFFLMAVSMVCLGCSTSADNNYYTSGQTSRSFTDSVFDYEQLKIEKIFHVVNEEYPSCSLMIDFFSENKMMIRGKEYRYKIEVGRIVILDPGDNESMISYLEVVSGNADSSEYIAVDHMFPSRHAAEKSGLWIGTLPSSMPYVFQAKWYRTSAIVGHSPTDMVMANTEKGDFLYVANSAGNSVSVIQTPENKVVGTIPVNIDPYRLAASQDGTYVYVTNAWDNTVSVIRTADHTVVKTIRVGRGPNGITVTADGSHVLVANTKDASVSIIETANHT